MVGLPALLVALLLIALVSWWLWPPTLTALWRRLALLGRMAGRKRMAWDTHHSYLSRLTETVSPPLTSDSLRAPLMEIAALTDKEQFSASGLDAPEQERWRTCWRQVARTALATLWRARLGRLPRRLRRV
jgi:hypothetical protein